MQQALSDCPFSPAIQRLTAEWRENAVVVGTDTFVPIPSRIKLRFKQLTGKLTDDDRESLSLPPLVGADEPEWMRDDVGDIVVAKRNGHFSRNYGWTPTAAREKIAADLGIYTSMPVLPVQIWEQPSRASGTTYFSISPKAFPVTYTAPSDEMLLADDSLAKISVFDQWIYNSDRHRGQILYGATEPSRHITKIYIDHGLSNYNSPKAVLPVLEQVINPLLEPAYVPISETVRQHVREQIISISPAVKNTFECIEEMPDQFIRETVNRLPDGLFSAPDPKKRMIDRLLYRRDHIRELTFKGAELIQP